MEVSLNQMLLRIVFNPASPSDAGGKSEQIGVWWIGTVTPE